jgi:mannose-1-phosphate guanylyltransferase
MSTPPPARHVAILAGGRGTRFWPVGRESVPKQFLALDGDDPRPLLRATYERVQPLCEGGQPWVVAPEALARGVRKMLPRLPPDRLILEPEGKNTAAAVALAALRVYAKDARAVLVVVPADHHVAPEGTYRRALRAMLDRAAQSGAILTLGLRPTYPATGYGYLALGKKTANTPAGAVHAVRRFVEKPSASEARRLVASRGYLWNGGTFAFRPDVLLAAMQRHWRAGLEPLDRAARERFAPAALAKAYRKVPSISVDYAVMEKATNLETLAARLDWDDLGSWDAVLRHARADRDGNVVADGSFAIDAKDCLVRSEDGVPVALVGVEGVTVVRTKDATLVLGRGKGEDVRKVVKALEKARRRDLLR